MPLLSPNVRLWLHGLLAATVGSFATAASGMLVLPNDFNFSHDGLVKMAKLTLVPTALSVFAYLKQSPVPKLNADNPENGQK